METKFIKGTNEQYSIREDGIIIRHYKWKGRKEYGHIYYENVIINYRKVPNRNGYYIIIRSNNKTFTWFKNAMLAKYFKFIICPRCNKKIETDSHIRICKTCVEDNFIKTLKKWRKNNKDLVLKSQRKNYYNNQDKYLLDSKKRVKNLNKSYIINKLKIPTSVVPSELIDIKRQQLLLHREIKKQLKT